MLLIGDFYVSKCTERIGYGKYPDVVRQSDKREPKGAKTEGSLRDGSIEMGLFNGDVRYNADNG